MGVPDKFNMLSDYRHKFSAHFTNRLFTSLRQIAKFIFNKAKFENYFKIVVVFFGSDIGDEDLSPTRSL